MLSLKALMSWWEMFSSIRLFTPTASLLGRRDLAPLLLLFLYERFRDSSLTSQVFHEGSDQVAQVRSQPLILTSLILCLKPATRKTNGTFAHAVFHGFLRLQLPNTPNNSQMCPGKVLVSVICCVTGHP